MRFKVESKETLHEFASYLFAMKLKHRIQSSSPKRRAPPHHQRERLRQNSIEQGYSSFQLILPLARLSPVRLSPVRLKLVRLGLVRLRLSVCQLSVWGLQTVGLLLGDELPSHLEMIFGGVFFVFRNASRQIGLLGR